MWVRAGDSPLRGKPERRVDAGEARGPEELAVGIDDKAVGRAEVDDAAAAPSVVLSCGDDGAEGGVGEEQGAVLPSLPSLVVSVG